MKHILSANSLYGKGKQTVVVENGTAKVIPSSASDSVCGSDNYIIFPGFADVHVHLREPGFSYKETIHSGTSAAAHGGYTAVCAMPNINPTPDSEEHLKVQLDAIRKSAAIKVYPYGAVTVGEKGETLSDMDEIANDVIAFSDDGKGVQSEQMMRSAMMKSKSLGKIICAHCEDDSMLHGGYIHAGKYAKLHGHKGICSESEWKPIERDLRLVKETGCSYHVCHVSCKESVELIRKAKKDGLDVTCETAPHYLLLDDSMLEEDGRFKMNPPLRDRSDREALTEGIKDGTIDMIATDHAPHSEEEKSHGLKDSLNGIVGLETAFPVLYTELVMNNVISLQKLVELMSLNPRKRFNIPLSDNDFTVFDLKNKYNVNSAEFLSMGRSTPFDGREVVGKCVMTVCDGRIVWKLTDDESEGDIR